MWISCQRAMAKEVEEEHPRLRVSGCSKEDIAERIHGSYESCGLHHEKPVFKKMHDLTQRDVFLYFWDGRDAPEYKGWWFGPKLGGSCAYAFAAITSQYPPESGWEVPHENRQQPDNILISVQPPHKPGATRKDYVEWRRIFPWDDTTNRPADADTFLRLCAKLGLRVHSKVRTNDGKQCTLQLCRSQYGGTLHFDGTKDGKITITQTNLEKKAAIWWLLEPHTYQCEERPAKRRRRGSAATSNTF